MIPAGDEVTDWQWLVGIACMSPVGMYIVHRVQLPTSVIVGPD